MAKKKKDEDLFSRLRDLGMRKSRARKVSESLHNSSRKAPKSARRAIADLTGAAAEVQDRISPGPQKRKRAAEKAARTRAQKARKRSKSAKKAAHSGQGTELIAASPVTVEVQDVAPGLWLWRQPHPDWNQDEDWPPEVASFAVESGGVGLLLDPLAPPPSAEEAWKRIEGLRPTVLAVLKPDHLRDIELSCAGMGLALLDRFCSGPMIFPAPSWSGVPTMSCRHGEPVHDRAAFEAALEAPPWGV